MGIALRRKNSLSIAAYILIAATPAAAIVAGEIASAHERLRADASYQFEFSSMPAPNPAPGWIRAIANLIATIFEILSPLINIVFWLGVILIIAGGAYYICRELYLRLRRTTTDDSVNAPSLYSTAPALARALLEEADSLAAEGRYGEAARVLLFRSIEDIQRFQPNHVRKAMTSREIARLSILPPPARKAFSQIAGAVEQCHFAGCEIGSEIFSECRAAYRIFADAEKWS